MAGVDLDQTLAACDSDLRSRPRDAATLDSRAFVLLHLRHDPEALAAYGVVLAAQPRDAASLYGRAVAETRLGMTAEAGRERTAALCIVSGGRSTVRRNGRAIRRLVCSW